MTKQAKKTAAIQKRRATARKSGIKPPALVEPATIVVDAPPPPRRQRKDSFLRADPAVSAANALPALRALARETAGAFDLASIADDGPGYGSRLRVLKALRGGQRVMVDDARVSRLRRELYALTGARLAGDFALKCAATLASADAAAKKLSKSIADSRRRDATAKAAFSRLHAAPVHDGRPVLDAPPASSKKDEAADAASFRAALAARVLRAEDEERVCPLATPRPDAELEVDLSTVAALQDRDNGVVLLRLERANSQGAICVYNNGRRVAAGVVAANTLNLLRQLAVEDIAGDVKRLLAPANGVPVTTAAARHLTAVLERCKENDMATKKTKKFEAPKGAAKKAAKKAAETGAPAERKSSLFRLLNDTKAVWSAFATQKGEIVGAFVKLGAVGKMAAGATRAQLIAALPNVAAKNISFYLSKWQPAGIVEKLPAAE